MILVITNTFNLGQQWGKPYPGGGGMGGSNKCVELCRLGHSQTLGEKGEVKKTAQIWWETLLRQLTCLTLD